jgi:uncharacterized protein YdiU (UPF0061 family)
MAEPRVTEKSQPSDAAGWNWEHSYRQLPEILYHTCDPEPSPQAATVYFNDALARDLGLNAEWLKLPEQSELFTGHRLPPGARPLAQAYAGHQYGHFTTLGDGRAHLLGEHLTPDGRRFDIQLKGSGRTPSSRRGDGKAGLGPMLREVLISEAMAHLGIPTTRSLAVATTGEEVWRETTLPGAVLCRVAASHIRVGTFQFLASREEFGALEQLLNYTVDRHFPALKESPAHDQPLALRFFHAVCQSQGDLIARWMMVGFIHGVMNTDNMAISGETIDYGPCAFMDNYDPATVFSSIDQRGRYAYGNQPQIARWNLARLAETLLPLFHQDQATAIKMAEAGLSDCFSAPFNQAWKRGMLAKLGLSPREEPAEAEADTQLIADFLEGLQRQTMDFTNAFRALTLGRPEAEPGFAREPLKSWLPRWQERAGRDPLSPAERDSLMRTANPAYIPRNHRVEEALKSAVEENNYAPFRKLLSVLQNPWTEKSEFARYTEPPQPGEKVQATFCGT